MEYKVPFLPASKRFFKISELAGKRWPNVTEDQIYEWHDMDFRVSVNLEIGGTPLKMGDISTGHHWNETPHFGQVNLMAFWMFFPKFFAFRSNPGRLFRPLLEDDMQSKFPDLQKLKNYPEIFNFDALDKSFLMIDTDSTKGFAFNKQGSVQGLMFYDEKGVFRAPVLFNEEIKIWEPTTIEIKKEDLLIRASSVQLLEAIAPEITRPDYQVKGSGLFNADVEEAVKPLEENQETLQLPPGAKTLTGWKQIASYTGFSVSNAQRKYRPVIRYEGDSKRVLTTTAAIDEFRLKSATKKKRKERGDAKK